MTSHTNVTRDYPVTSRVSHATHTTPHHTMSLAGVVRGLSVAKKSIHRYCSRGPANTTPGSALGTAHVVSASVMDGHYVASDGGA